MIKKKEVENLKERIGFPNAFGVASIGKAGGLCLYWKEEVEFTLVSFSQNHICGDISHNGVRAWRFVGVYGWSREEEKHRTWTLLRHISEETKCPIIFGGDFNEIMSYGEKEGGADRVRREVVPFRETVDACNLRDLGYEGSWFTWERGTSFETRVRECLDRYLASQCWIDMFPKAWVEHSLRYKSDHMAILLHLKEKVRKRRKKKKEFKIETVWLLDESCEHTVKSAWSSSEGRATLDRIAAVGRSLVGWSAEKFDKLGKQIEETEKALRKAQQC